MSQKICKNPIRLRIISGAITIFFIVITILASSFPASAVEISPPKLSGNIPLPKVKGGFDLMAIDLAVKRLLSEPKWVVYRPESHKR